MTKWPFINIPLKPTCEIFATLQNEESGWICEAIIDKFFRDGNPEVPEYLKEYYEKLCWYIEEQTMHPHRRCWDESQAAKNKMDRNSTKYIEWRKNIFERDGYRCQICGKVGGRLNAHHIKPFAKFPEYRFDPDNGVTLCTDCHKAVHRGEIECQTGS